MGKAADLSEDMFAFLSEKLSTGKLLLGTLPECGPLRHLHGVPAKARGTEHAYDYFAMLVCPFFCSHDVRRELLSVQCWPRARTWPEGCSVSGAMFLQAHMSRHCTIRASEFGM